MTDRSDQTGVGAGREDGVDAARDVTRLLGAVARGERLASDELLGLLYGELRSLASARLARAGPGQTLQATALVHEAYMKLVGTGEDPGWDSRGHFFASAAQAMREVLIDRARARGRLKRGGGRRRVDLGESAVISVEDSDEAGDGGVDLVALDAALRRLEAEDPRAAQVVVLRYFGGLEIEQAAKALGVSVPTINRDWRFAKAFLASALSEGDEGEGTP
ncbi:MAG: sigma-70 family RNA polymerase sigma factor [Phycisphaeraceae bacterium]|nr:MAG: sigma-70 family RNA polymerase sigma factor [Phycisphaeraceae bacterium]